MDALLYSFEIWSSNDNWLSKAIPKSHQILRFNFVVIELRVFLELIFIVDFCRSINWNLSGFTIMLLFLN